MSVTAAVKRIRQAIRDEVATIAPFRATVTAVSAGLVEIKRVGATTAEARTYARCVGFALAVNDVVLCANLNGEPVVVAKLQTAAPSRFDLDADLRLTGNAGLQSYGTTPSIAAGAAAGTSPTIGIEGTDRCGKLFITPGTSPTTGTLATITFATPLASANYVVMLQEADLDAAEDRGYAYPEYSACSTTSWRLDTAVALTSGSHHWFYWIVIYEP